MSYELIKKIVLEDRPFPCQYCNRGVNVYSSLGIQRCSDACPRYADWTNGKVIIPDGFDEVREIKE